MVCHRRYSRRQLLANAAIAALARRLVAVDRPAVFVVAIGQRPQPWLAYRRGRGPALCLRALAARASALAAWRSTARSPRGRYPSKARRRVLRGRTQGSAPRSSRRSYADPGAEQPAARAVATRLVRCQSEPLAHHASTLASGATAAAFMMGRRRRYQQARRNRRHSTRQMIARRTRA